MKLCVGYHTIVLLSSLMWAQSLNFPLYYVTLLDHEKWIILGIQLSINSFDSFQFYCKAAAAAFAICTSLSTLPPLAPTAPTKLPPTFSGTPPPKNNKP